MDSSAIPVVVSVLMLSMVSTVATADSLYFDCSNEHGNYSANSTFENNLKILLQYISSNTSVTGFYNTSVGEGGDQVYGQALCRGDVGSADCQDCIKTATQGVVDKCNANDAMIWYELCQVRYSFQNFFSQQIYTGKYINTDYHGNVTSDPVRLSSYWMYMMRNISSEAAFNRSLMFATGEINYSTTQKIYGLVQCTRDISESDCKSCFNSALTDLNGCCSSKEGASILSRNCNVMFGVSHFYNGSSTFLLTYIGSKAGDKWKKWMVVLVICAAALALVLFTGLVAVYIKRRRKECDEERRPNALFPDYVAPVGVEMTTEGDLVSAEELPFMDLSTIKAATDDFSDSNKLGQGGFGAVYKGVLSDGKEVAVKRLSRKSWQGLEQFKNEVILIAKLQHRNLVRLVGCGLEGDEKLLVYEFMPNRSLDLLIFDRERRSQLDWQTCYAIIDGIARGLVYLHEDSRHRIIHRDLKPSNVLLDNEMVAKISDFGMARIFDDNQSTANTKRVVGTYGYMAPEYAMGGLFSIKSDVFSFGVILLEIISGKRNSGFYVTELAQSLLAYAWRLWNEGKELEFVEPSLVESGSTLEILRCVQIGLLCVQEDPADRPTMSEVVTLLGSETQAPPAPKQPAFAVGRVGPVIEHSSGTSFSVNHMTVSSISPR